MPFYSAEYKVYLDPAQNPDKTALWFRHGLIGFCLVRPELGLANEAVFGMTTNALVDAICARQNETAPL